MNASTANIGTLDLNLRGLFGALSFVGAVVTTIKLHAPTNLLAGGGLLALAIVLYVTAGLQVCPLYKVLGISTRRAQRRA